MGALMIIIEAIMRNADPLITLNYMGGPLPIHLTLGVLGITVYWTCSKSIQCSSTDSEEKSNLSSTYSDIYSMAVAHSLFALLFIIKKSIKSHYENGLLFKTILS
jgi:hypothetical protein